MSDAGECIDCGRTMDLHGISDPDPDDFVCYECDRDRARDEVAEWASRYKRACALAAELEVEVDRLRRVIRTGGAMYRAERASMGIPGGIDDEGQAVVPSVCKVDKYSSAACDLGTKGCSLAHGDTDQDRSAAARPCSGNQSGQAGVTPAAATISSQNEAFPVRECKSCSARTRSTSTIDHCIMCGDSDGLRPKHFLTRDKPDAQHPNEAGPCDSRLYGMPGAVHSCALRHGHAGLHESEIGATWSDPRPDDALPDDMSDLPASVFTDDDPRSRCHKCQQSIETGDRYVELHVQCAETPVASDPPWVRAPDAWNAAVEQAAGLIGARANKGMTTDPATLIRMILNTRTLTGSTGA